MSSRSYKKSKSIKSIKSIKSDVKNRCMYINKNDVQCRRNEAVKGVWFCNLHLNNIFNLKFEDNIL